MAHINRRYIDNHWLIYAFRGIITLIFGLFTLFSSGNDLLNLISIVGVFLLSLSVIEFANALYRAHIKRGWGVSVTVALLDAIIAMVLLLSLEQNLIWHLVIIAIYTITRGICDIIAAFRTTVDPTDRSIWLICGICGSIMGIVIFNSSHLAATDFIHFFGAYLLIMGISSLIYGIHNRSQKLEDSIARSESAKNRVTSKKKSSKSARRLSK